MFEALTILKSVIGWIGWLGLGVVPVAIAALVVWLNPALLRPALAVAGVWVALFAVYTIGDGNGAARVQAEWDAAKVEYAEEKERLRESVQTAAQASVTQTQSAEVAKDSTDAKEVATYEQAHPPVSSDDCRISDDDLRAAGRMQPDGRANRGGLRKNPRRL